MKAYEFINSVAADLESAVHDPESLSYRAFCNETVFQYRFMLAKGIKVTQISGTLTGTSEDLFQRLDASNDLTIAVDGSPMAENHPLAQFLPEFGMTLNTVFRSVHDYFGHYRTRSPFETFSGEITAYTNHAKMYSPAAKPALFGETIAQLCWYFSRHEFVPIQICAIVPVRALPTIEECHSVN